jgi:hypothetical protein
MDGFATELEACLDELDRGEDAGATMVIPAATRLGPPPRGRKPAPRLPIFIGSLGALAIAAVVVGLLTLGGKGNAVPVGAQIATAGVGAFDPFGDGTEHDAAAINATDGNPATYWPTETYNSPLDRVKKGVGMLLDAHGVTQVSRITVVTDTPGFTAEIRATNIRGTLGQAVSDNRVVSRTTRFAINESTPKRYYLIWITKFSPNAHFAHINDVRAFGKA